MNLRSHYRNGKYYDKTEYAKGNGEKWKGY